MSTSMAGFVPSYSAFAGDHSRLSDGAAQEVELPRLAGIAIKRGNDVVRAFQGLVDRTAFGGMETKFRPSYSLSSPALTLSGTELHETLAKKQYIESIGGILGAAVVARLHELACVDAGWDGANADAMSLDSLSSLNEFFQRAGHFSDDIGFFLGYEGEILINWREGAGGLVDIAFVEGTAQICTDDWEGVFSIQDPELYSLISNDNFTQA